MITLQMTFRRVAAFSPLTRMCISRCHSRNATKRPDFPNPCQKGSVASTELLQHKVFVCVLPFTRVIHAQSAGSVRSLSILEANEHSQVGIVSYGPPLAYGGPSPNSVFTRVSSFNAAAARGPAASTASTPNQPEVDYFIGSTLAQLGVPAPAAAQPPPPPPPLLSLPATSPPLPPPPLSAPPPTSAAPIASPAASPTA